MTVAILGAAGATGKAITATLAAEGQKVRVVGRHRERLVSAFGRFGESVEPVAADLETPEGAKAALRGVETAIVTLGLPYTEFARYPALMRNVVEAAVGEGVRRMALVTNIYPYGMPRSPRVDETHPREPASFKGRMRLEQEDALLEAHRAGRLQALVLRLPDFFGAEAESSYAKTVFDTALAGKPANLFAPADTPHQFVYVPDVGPVMAALLKTEAAWGEVVHFAGSGDITVRQFAEKVYAAAGAKLRVLSVGKWMVRAIGLFNPIMRELVEMHYLQTTPVMLDDERLRSLIGNVHRTSYDEGIAETLSTLRERAAR